MRWDSAMEGALLDALMQAQERGLQTDNASFKAAGWEMALTSVQQATTQNVVTHQIKVKYDTLKQDWKAWKSFIEHTGFGWDEEKGVPTAEPEILETYFQSNPRARKFRDRPLPHAEKLQTLLDGAVATGEHASTPLNAMRYLSGHSASQLIEDDEMLVPHNDEIDHGSDVPEEIEWSPSPPRATLHTTSRGEIDDGLAMATPSPTTPEPASIPSVNARRESGLRLRKRSSRNAMEAESRKRNKNSGHAVADALDRTVEEWKVSNKLLADQDISGRVVALIVSEFKDLSVLEKDLISSTLDNKMRANLFLALTQEERKVWVARQLSEANNEDQDMSLYNS